MAGDPGKKPHRIRRLLSDLTSRALCPSQQCDFFHTEIMRCVISVTAGASDTFPSAVDKPWLDTKEERKCNDDFNL